MSPCAVAETFRTSYAAVEVATRAPKCEQCDQSISKGALRPVKNTMVKGRATNRFCHLACGALKENVDLPETVAGIDSLDDEKKMAFAKAIGQDGRKIRGMRFGRPRMPLPLRETSNTTLTTNYRPASNIF